MKRPGTLLALLSLALFAGLATLDASPLDEVVRSRHNLALPRFLLPPPVRSAISIRSPEPRRRPKRSPPKQRPPLRLKGAEPPLWGSREGAEYRLTATLSAKSHPYNQPTGSSLTCLACHDGALAKDMHGVNVDTARLGAEANTSWEGGFSPGKRRH